MKKLSFKLMMLLFVVPVVIFSTFVGCGEKKDEVATKQEATQAIGEANTTDTSKTDKDVAKGTKKKVALVSATKDSYVLDAANQALKALEGKGFKQGENLEVLQLNLEGKAENAPQIIEQVLAFKPDVVFSEGVGISVEKFVKPIARDAGLLVVMSSVVTSSGDYKFIESKEKPGKNLTGVKHTGVTIQTNAFKLLDNISPLKGKKAVFITTEGMFTREETEAALKSVGVELKDYKSTNIFEEYQDFVTKYNKDSDVGWVLYGLTPWAIRKDGTSVSRDEFIKWDLENNKKPNVSYWESAVKNFMLCGIGVDVGAAGFQAGEIMAKVLNGEKPAEIPIQEAKKVQIVLNANRAKELNIEFTPQIMGSAFRIYTDYKGNYQGK